MAAQASQSGCGTRSGEGGYASEECKGKRNYALNISSVVMMSILICNTKAFHFKKVNFFLNLLYCIEHKFRHSCIVLDIVLGLFVHLV